MTEIPNDVMQTAERLWGGSVLDIARAIMENSRRQWQPIETVPRDGTNILACSVYTTYKGTSGYNWLSEIWMDADGSFGFAAGNDDPDEFSEPTHWMPLPEPPEGGE